MSTAIQSSKKLREGGVPAKRSFKKFIKLFKSFINSVHGVLRSFKVVLKGFTEFKEVLRTFKKF